MRRSAAIALLAVAACRPADPVLAPAPADISWAALLQVDAGGKLLAASRLARWEGGLPIFAPAEGDALVAGYTAAQIGAEVGDAPLRAARGCAGRLPAPAWAARWREEDRVEAIAPGAVPALSAPWLEGVCPARDLSAAAVDVSCEEVRCRVALTGAQCAVKVDLSACALPALDGVFEADGELCDEGVSADWTCTAIATATGAVASRRCAGGERVCDVDLYLDAPEPPYQVARAHLFRGAAPWLPSWLFDILVRVRTEGLTSGYAWDLAILGDEVVIAGGDGATPEESCTRTTPSRLTFLSLESMAPVRTVTTAPCLTRIAKLGNGFAGVGVDRGKHVLIRFDARGRELARALADARTSSIALDPATRQARELIAVGGRLVALFDSEHVKGRLYTYDAGTLAARDRLDLTDDDPRTMLDLTPDLIAVADSYDRGLTWIDVAAARPRARFVLPKNTSADYGSIFGMARAPDGKLLLAATVPADVYVVAPGGQALTRAPIFDRDVDPISIEVWPGDARLALVAGTARTPSGGFEATLSFFDTARGRFRRGTWAVGHGLINRLRTDAKGRVWALLPWSGEVVRITPSRTTTGG